MREIKFRVWDCDEMFYNCTVGGFPETNTSVYSQDKGWMECTEKSITMQYTGFQDKNGKKIYESDIVNTGSYIGSGVVVNAGYENRKVEWANSLGAWWIGDILGLFHPDEELEVIGNIYENPEISINK